MAQEIISNILFYEKRFLLNGGLSQRSAEMQELLGLHFQEVSSSYQFIAKPAPSFNHIQALKVCNLICIYKLAEVVSLDNNSIEFGTMLHPLPMDSESASFQMPMDATFLMNQISSWPKVLEGFQKSQMVSEPSGENVRSLASQPASLQLLHALSDNNGRKLSAKIHHNVLIAAAHIAYIKEHPLDSDNAKDNLPDLPDLTSPYVQTSIYFSFSHSSFL